MMNNSIIPLLISFPIIYAFSLSEGEVRVNYYGKQTELLMSQRDEDTICDEEDVFFIVEEMPKFQGKDIEAFKAWIANNIKYPPAAKQDSISGKVYIQFTVNCRGKVEDVIVVRGVHPDLDAEAVRVVKSSPLWTPGKQRGKKVSVVLTFPVIFVLKECGSSHPHDNPRT
jgi:TonB family protein